MRANTPCGTARGGLSGRFSSAVSLACEGKGGISGVGFISFCSGIVGFGVGTSLAVGVGFGVDVGFEVGIIVGFGVTAGEGSGDGDGEGRGIRITGDGVGLVIGVGLSVEKAWYKSRGFSVELDHCAIINAL